MKAKALLILIAMIGASAFPHIVTSQQARPVGYPTAQVKEANKQLDSFVQELAHRYFLPFSLTDEERLVLVDKYLGESKRSPYFWQHLRNIFEEAHILELYACENCASFRPPNVQMKAMVTYSLSTIASSSWGTLNMKSQPSGADVFLKISSGRTKEGNTEINRRYPEGGYTFILEMKGYKTKEIGVSIKKETPVEENVTLEKE